LYFYACAETGDNYYRSAIGLAGAAAGGGTQLWTAWDMVSETVTLLRYRHSATAAIRCLDERQARPPHRRVRRGGARRG
jgi:hypothetical protein